MIAIGAVLGDRLGDSVPLQPCRYVLDGLPYKLIMRVSRGLECGSHAAAPAVLTIRCVADCYPSWSRRYWMCSWQSSSQSDIRAIPGRSGVVALGSCLYTNGRGQHLTAVARMLARRLEACAIGSACSLA